MNDRLQVWADEIAASFAALIVLAGLSLSVLGAFGPLPETMGRRALRRVFRRLEADEVVEQAYGRYHACPDGADGWAELSSAALAAKR